MPVRERKTQKAQRSTPSNRTDDRGSSRSKTPTAKPVEPSGFKFKVGWIVYCLLGVSLAVWIGAKYAWFMNQLHENDMFFSSIKEVEREISFRTESGLYYSYYKQVVNARNVGDGITSLMHDNLTEYGHTINLLERMNIYQEAFLGAVYHFFKYPLLRYTEPVYFYLNTIWTLQAVYCAALFFTAWLLTRSWAAGVLASVFFIFNRHDTTRVWFTMPLRESFSMPFIFAQLVFVTWYLRIKAPSATKILSLVGILLCTVLFVITWQFAQFVLLLQAFSLYSVQALQLVPTKKVRAIMLIQLVSLFIVYVMQFGNTLIPRSLVISFVLACLVVFTVQGNKGPQSGSFLFSIVKLLLFTVVVFVVGGVINYGIKMVIPEEADSHIYNFVKAKFGLFSPRKNRDFDVLLYLCDPSFKSLPYDTFDRLWENLLLPPYLLSLVGLVMLAGMTVLKNWWVQSKAAKSSAKTDDSTASDNISSDEDGNGRVGLLLDRPDLAYHVLHALFFGFMAVTTLRFKFLWTPHVCILAALPFADHDAWTWLLARFRVVHRFAGKIMQHIAGLGYAALIVYLLLPGTLKDLEDLREFYDPDTVDLMEWIKKGTKPTDSFTGSMQLLAGVKLCTGRPITNHPHYEDKRLRQRTRQLYQVYGKHPPEKVHQILRSFDSRYIILEDSICFARNDFRWPACRLPDIIDQCNGHQLDEPTGVDEEDLVEAKHERFCDAIEHDSRYKKLFRKVFHNKTFRVYRVLGAPQ